MSSVVIQCPKQWDGFSAVQFVNECAAAVEAEHISIDFSAVEFVKPYGTLLIAGSIKNLVTSCRSRSHKIEALVPKGDIQAISYLRHIGFFRHIGLDTGKQPGEARGSATYLPICNITLAELKSAAGSEIFQRGVETITGRLAEVVYPRVTEQIMMQYCLREVVRNVFEHADTDQCTVLAQRYKDGWAEIAIADEGIGIYGSLSQTMTIPSVDVALALAVRPGVSRVTQPQHRGEWDNSGFGLFVLSELGHEAGEFTLASNGRYIQIQRGVPLPRFDGVQVSGTAIKLLVDLESAEYFPNRLQQLVQRGEQAHYQATGITKHASKRSKSAGSR